MAMEPPIESGRFRTTRWTLIRRAGGEELEESQAALAELCEAYWGPVYRFIQRGGRQEQDARDSTQAFFTRLIETRDFDSVDAARGRFRAWLLGCVKHFLANEGAYRDSLKRGGGHRVLSLDFEAEQAMQVTDDRALDPEAAFARDWTLALLERVLGQLGVEYGGAGQGALFAALRPRLQPGGEGRPFEELAEEFDRTPGSLKTAMHRLRRRYGELLRREVAETMEDPSQVEEEIRGLFESVSSAGKS